MQKFIYHNICFFYVFPFLQVWNSVGIIRCINNHEENSIDIRFHDTAIHHSIHMNNILGHTVASLSTKAVVLACPTADDTPRCV